MERHLSLRTYLAALIAVFAAALAAGSPATAATQQTTRCQLWSPYLQSSSCIVAVGAATSNVQLRATQAKKRAPRRRVLVLCRDPYTSKPIECH